MPELSRTQLVVYAALAVVGLLLGARWVRAAEDGRARGSSPGYAGGAPAAEAGGEADPAALEFEAGSGDVVVHVVGAVEDPGVFRLPSGSRVTDAVDRAGGATREAALEGINLAARLADGQQVNVPARSTAPGGIGSGSVDAASAELDAPISLGTATVEQLDTIEGVGPVTAAEIVEFRDSHGGLSSIDQLDEISGVGPATMEALRARLQP